MTVLKRIQGRVGLLGAFLLFAALLFLGQAAFGYRAFVSAGEQRDRKILTQTSDSVVSKIEEFEVDTEALLLKLSDPLDPHRLDFLNPNEANAFLMWYMRTHPHITSVNFGDSLGNGYLILSSEGHWRNRLKSAAHKGVVTWVELDDEGRPVSRKESPDEYDPRTRPWYRDAAGPPGIVWSTPYVFRTTREPGITASTRIDSGQGGTVQVVGVDVLLSDISELLAELSRENSGLAVWIASDEGRVLASSDEKTFLPHLKQNSAELPDMSGGDFQDVRAAVQALGPGALGAGAGFREFKSNGRSLYGLAKPVTLSGNLGLSAVTFVPKESIFSYVESVGWIRMFLFLLFAAGSSALFMWRYLMPIRRLRRSVQTLGTDRYARPAATDRTDEVGVLVSEFTRVADDLEVRRRELTESEARYRRLFESVHDGIFETDAEGRFVRVNQGLAEIHGVASAEQMIGTRVVDVWDDPKERAKYLDKLESQKSMSSYRSGARRQDGIPIIVEISAVRIEGPTGEFLGTEGIIRDVTESVEAAESLRRATEEWRDTFDSMPDLVSLHDSQYRIVKANKTMADFFGVRPAELVGLNCHQIYHGSDTPCAECPFPKAAETLETVFAEIDEPHLGIPLTMTVSPIMGDDGPVKGCVHVARDMSSQRRLEELLHQSQKMEAVGRLAGGVAHDFNNMLSVIMGFTEEAIAKIGIADPAVQDLLEVRSAAGRSANLTRQLLAFSRRQPIEPHVVDLNKRLRGMEGMLRRLLGEDVQMELDLSPDLWPVLVDPSQIDQAIANLASNSRDAMPGGGMLVVKTANITLGALEVENAEGVAEGDYAMLAVGDNGQGIDRETLLHIFEPFYTTKGEGKGTGLGLATVYGSMRQNGGWIGADSTPGIGTTFRVYLPRYLGEDGGRPIPAAVGPGTARGETVLLVEDEKQVRRLARICLERLGYVVIEATGPEEALAQCVQHRGTIHLLLSDVVMPDMNGKALAKRVRDLRPGIKVLFMSGYTADVITSRGILDEGMDFLEKPFTPEGLGQKVRFVLDEA